MSRISSFGIASSSTSFAAGQASAGEWQDGADDTHDTLHEADKRPGWRHEWRRIGTVDDAIDGSPETIDQTVVAHPGGTKGVACGQPRRTLVPGSNDGKSPAQRVAHDIQRQILEPFSRSPISLCTDM